MFYKIFVSDTVQFGVTSMYLLRVTYDTRVTRVSDTHVQKVTTERMNLAMGKRVGGPRSNQSLIVSFSSSNYLSP